MRGLRRDHDREQAIKLTRLPEKLYHVCSSFENRYTAPLRADPNCISGFSTFIMMAYDLSDSVNVVLYNNVAHPHFPWCRFRARHTVATL